MCNKQPRQPKVRSHLKPTIRPATGSPGIFIKPLFEGAFFPRFIRRKQKTELGPFTSESSSILPYYRKSGINQIIGDTNPDFTFGMTHNFSYKNFSLSFFLQGCVGGDIFNANLMEVTMSGIGNIPQEMYNTRWTPENRAIAKWPKAYAGYGRTMKLSDRYVEDGSYLRMKNINLGYKWIPSFKGIESVNLYVSVSNVFTISGYSWFDPDVNSFGSDSSRRGVDMFSYPSSRTFSFGLQCTF